VRVAILHRNIPAKWPLFFSFLTGLAQDFFIAFQQLFLLLLFIALFPFALPYLFWVFVSFSSLLQLHILFDGFLRRKEGIRMEISFFSFVDDARCFWDSAKEKNIFRFLPGAFLFLLIPFFSYYWYWSELQVAFFSEGWIVWGVVCGLIGTAGVLFLPKKISYAIDHIVFQHELWFLQKVYRFFKRKSDQTGLSYLAKPFCNAQNEKKSYPSSEYPLFKYTHGFYGKKSCDVMVKKGEKPHLIFLFLESFRTRNVGCLGGEWGVTPQFDRLAKEGILFSNFYANSVRTSRSVISSLYGVPSDVDASEVSVKVDMPLVGIPDLLNDFGYESTYLHNGPIHFENQDLFFKNHRYHAVLGQHDILQKFPGVKSTSWGLPDEYLMEYAAHYLEKHQGIPQFLTLFTISNHHPWNPPPHHQQLVSDFKNSDTDWHPNFSVGRKCVSSGGNLNELCLARAQSHDGKDGPNMSANFCSQTLNLPIL
jgi:phosphoglycerol transferase MdoB-like AlkP superfamily enzyme